MELNLNIKAKTKGEYMYERLDADDNVIESSRWFDNLILNSGLDWILSRDTGIDILMQCRIGTGNAAEDPTQTALQSQTDTVLYTATGGSRTDVVQSTTPYYEEVTAVYLFPAFTVARNIAELGVGPSAVGSSLYSRALVKDPGGVPTVVSVLVGEKFRVTYRCRLYYQMDADVAGTVDISGVTYNYTGRMHSLNSSYARGRWYAAFRFGPQPDTNSFPNYASFVGQATGLALANTTSLPPRTGSFSSSDSSGSNFVAGVYTAGSFSRTYQMVVPDTIANFTPGLNWFLLQSPLGFYQWLITPAIPKTADFRLRLNFTFTVARYAP